MFSNNWSNSKQEVYRIMQSKCFDYLFGETYSSLIKKRDKILEEIKSYEADENIIRIAIVESFPDPGFIYERNLTLEMAIFNILYYKKLNMRNYTPGERLDALDEMCREIIDMVKASPELSYLEIIQRIENKEPEEALEILIEDGIIRNERSYKTWNWHVDRKYNKGNLLMRRFLEAQNTTYEIALNDIKNYNKVSNWANYIFPQINVHGMICYVGCYGLENIEEAKTYYNTPILKERLLEASEALCQIETSDPIKVMGYVHSIKVKNSMTLFAEIVPEQPVFQKVLDKFFQGTKDELTLSFIENQNSK